MKHKLQKIYSNIINNHWIKSSTENVNFQNTKWYVWLALIASIIQIWTFIKVTDTQTDIKNIQADTLYNDQNGIITKGLSGEEFFQMYFNFSVKRII